MVMCYKDCKIGLVTILDFDNYGNRLQNYATQLFFRELGYDVITLLNCPLTNSKDFLLLRYLKWRLRNNSTYSLNEGRKIAFERFNENIIFSKKNITPYSVLGDYSFFVAGSDQIWNPYFGRLRDVDLLCFARKRPRLSFSSSFGISDLNLKLSKRLKEEFKKFDALSVREDNAKIMIAKLLDRDSAVVLCDPTMLISYDDWVKVERKPNFCFSNKYILLYFLGGIDENIFQQIKLFASKNSCQIIDVLDKKSVFYQCGPSEFLYLERNAFYIFTDSFHSCVFSIIFKRPFVVFDRKGTNISMNSRIETLLNKFNLSDRVFNNDINNSNLICDFSKVDDILRVEKQKAVKFVDCFISKCF